MNKAVIVTTVVAVSGWFIFNEIKQNVKAVEREDITTPIYTIGEAEDYSAALAEGKRVVKFGPMFWGLYSGGLAFRTIDAARAYMDNNDWDQKTWSVYQLSGDYALDVTDGFTNKTLLVVEETSSSRLTQ
ncbi:hypothetical protein [Coralliovum pocilloporae]|uniref:hypothetical protein n=1 Tax=Coralliovum pocilloporae TaxID=3066369 RepID=UPI003307240C